jgi:hypothetical protein
MTGPRYPIYIPSKNRLEVDLTTRFLREDGVPFFLVVEPQEKYAYAARHGSERVLTLPLDDQGLIYARNWIKQHATAAGYERHWQLDDNIRRMRRWYRGKRIPVRSGAGFAVMEDFADRYENIAVAGPNYTTFAAQDGKQPRIPFLLNAHVYSCSLILNALPYQWRSRYNDDTDFCLQSLAGGWCTALFNAFVVDKLRTMVVAGGNTDALYQGDGRLKMAKALERLWPGVVETKRRFKRPQHVVKDSWKRFDTPLKLKPGIDLAAIPPNDYGLKLVAVKEVKSERLKRLLEEDQSAQAEQSQR